MSESIEEDAEQVQAAIAILVGRDRRVLESINREFDTSCSVSWR